MKKFLSIITITTAFTIILASCSRNPAGQPIPIADTTGFAQFQAWKKMQEQEAAKTVYVPVAKTKTVVMTSSTTNEANVSKKKGWSKAAKYAVIGGGSGAVLGAVINKRNRVAGGVVGGIVGGGLGYLFGRSKDKKEGRY